MTKYTSWGIGKKNNLLYRECRIRLWHEDVINLLFWLGIYHQFSHSFYHLFCSFPLKLHLFSVLLEWKIFSFNWNMCSLLYVLKRFCFVTITAYAWATAAYCTFWDWQKDLWQCIWQSHQVVFLVLCLLSFFLAW